MSESLEAEVEKLKVRFLELTRTVEWLRDVVEARFWTEPVREFSKKSRSEKKTKMLQVWCAPSFLKTFKEFVKNRRFESYEDALRYALNCAVYMEKQHALSAP